MRFAMELPRWLSGKESACQCRRWRGLSFDPWVRKIPWSRRRQVTPVFLPGKSHGQGSLAGYSLWGPKGSDTTEWLSTHDGCTTMWIYYNHWIIVLKKEECQSQPQPWPQHLKKKKMSDCSGNYHYSCFIDENIGLRNSVTLEKETATHPSILPGKSQGKRGAWQASPEVARVGRGWATKLWAPPRLCNGHDSKRCENASTSLGTKQMQHLSCLLHFRKESKTAQIFGGQTRGLGEAVAAQRGSATSQQLSPGRDRGHGTVFLLPACGCFLTPPFVQIHPRWRSRCHGERRPLLSRVTVTTSLGPEPAQPKGRLILPSQVRLCRLCASRGRPAAWRLPCRLAVSPEGAKGGQAGPPTDFHPVFWGTLGEERVGGHGFQSGRLCL